LVAVAALSSVPTPAAAAPPPQPGPAAGSDQHGNPSEKAKAVSEAKKTKKRVEVVGLRERDETTFANPDGSFTEVSTPVPTRAEAADGTLVSVDTALTASAGRLRPKASNSKVSILATATPTTSGTKKSGMAPRLAPSEAGGEGSTANVVNLDLPGAADITMGFAAALPAPVVAGDTATYELSSTSALTVQAMDDGFAENVVLEAAPASAPVYRFPVSVAGGLTPKLADGVLKFTDSKDEVVAISRPLQMWDAHRDSAGDPDRFHPVNATLDKTATGWQLSLAPSMDYLSDPATQYPVVVDPTVVTKDAGDNWYYPGNTVDHGVDYYFRVGLFGGVANRGYMNWNTGKFAGRTVTNATMSLYQYEAASCTAQPTKFFPTTTFSAVDANNVQVNNDAAWTTAPSFNTGGAGCSNSPNGYVSVDITKIVEAWTSGKIKQYGLEMRANDETIAAQFKRFCTVNAAPAGTAHCEGTSGVPSLAVTFNDDLGVQPSYKMIDHKLNDRSQLSVNARNGNAVLNASDVFLNGRGNDLNIDRFYNSLATEDSQFGLGWSMSVGPDVYLNRGSTSDRWDYNAPGGTRFGRFVRYNKLPSPNPDNIDTNDFHTPNYGGLNADLVDQGSGVFKMTIKSTQEKYYFDNLGCSTCDAVLSKEVDRNDNTIDYHYDNASRRLTSITDSHGRDLDIDHNTAGYVTAITERTAYTSSPRTWAYHYNTLNQLDYYIDPTGARTDYGYTNNLLTLITDPAQADGKRPKTALTYNNGQVTQVDYTDDAAGNTKRFTYAYSTNVDDAQAACNTDDKWSTFTTVTNASDPQGGATKYCFKDRQKNPNLTNPNTKSDADDPKVRTIDGKNRRRTTSFTPNQDSSSGTDQGNEGTTDGSTVYSYNANNTLGKATQPKDTAGNTAGTTSFDYANGSTVAGGSFLPTSSATNAGSCSSMKYDARGNLTDTYAGLAATSANGTCSGGTNNRRNHVDYNADGTPTSAYGPETSTLSSITPADKTQYFYYTTEPNKGELQKVVRPGGSATCTTDRTGCTTFIYDGYSRVTTTTDGNGNITRYSYDANDRITQVLTGGATTCDYNAGTCITYAFDGEGNLTRRVDRQGTTSFGYDWQNRQTSQTQPDGTVLNNTFDGAGNLTQYKQTIPGQAADTVNYTYDAANSLTKVSDVTGDYSYTYNNDARPTKMTLPVTGVSINYTYTKSGKVKKIEPLGGTSLPTYTYDYNDGTDEDSRLHKVTTGGVDTVYHYDNDDRLKDATPTSGTTYAYTYDGNGNIKTAKAGTTTTYYGYNIDNQLCWSGTANGTQMARNCPTTPSGNTAYTSDKQGNNLGTTAGPIQYNNQNQVSQISSPTGAGPVAMGYLDQGNNIRITAGGDSFTTGGKQGVTARRNTNGITYYTRDNNGQILNSHGAGGTYHYLTDRLGSTMALIDTTGAKAGSYTYDPYGKTTVTSGTSTTAAQNNPWRYIGGYQNPTDGYYKFGARYYDAAGHFTQADPVAGNISRPEKYNSYGYVAGDPINNTDLSGQALNFGEETATTVGGTIGAAAAAGVFCAFTAGVGCAIAAGVIGGAVGGGLAGAGYASATGGNAGEAALGGAYSGALGGVLGFGGIGNGVSKAVRLGAASF
jgi:RHS repeat-associated protein